MRSARSCDSFAGSDRRAIICSAQQVDPRVYEELSNYQRAGGMVVSYDSPIPLACDQVIFDREDNAYRAAYCLLEQGHRKIGIGISLKDGQQITRSNSDPISTRLRGFHRALAEYGIEPTPEWHFYNPTYERGGAEMARQYMQLEDRPTGVCIVNDYVALAFMVELMRAGIRVPKDVSIISHDNQPIASYCPVPLTSVTHPVQNIVDAVVQMLFERLDHVIPDDTPPRTVVVMGDIVHRESVAGVG